MPINNLHDAALAVRGARQAMFRLLDQTEPLEREYHQRSNILHKNDPTTPQERFDELAKETGYRAFYDEIDALRDMLDGVDAMGRSEARQSGNEGVSQGRSRG